MLETLKEVLVSQSPRLKVRVLGGGELIHRYNKKKLSRAVSDVLYRRVSRVLAAELIF